MTRELAIVHARENIRVNALCPGPLRTEMLMKFLDTDEKKQRRLGPHSHGPVWPGQRDGRRGFVFGLRRIELRNRYGVHGRRRNYVSLCDPRRILMRDFYGLRRS